jgi:predicted nucleic acid-binding protein
LEEVVLDSSIIIKSIVKPGHWLPNEIYQRELETHRKAKTLVKTLKSAGVTVLIPYPVVVEVAAVIRRLANKELAEKIANSLMTTTGYIIVYEEEYRSKALQVALETGSSGFDAYIIALAWDRDALLITDDEPTSKHAKMIGVRAVLLRNTSLEDIIKRIK